MPIVIVIFSAISAAASLGTLAVAYQGVKRVNTEIDLAKEELEKFKTKTEKARQAFIQNI